MCVCTLVQNKAGCLSFAGCGDRFASMPSLSQEGERDTERDVALYGGETGLPRRICGGEISARADVAAVRVRRFHAGRAKC